jgi:hypothetical protein
VFICIDGDSTQNGGAIENMTSHIITDDDLMLDEPNDSKQFEYGNDSVCIRTDDNPSGTSLNTAALIK